MSKLVDIENWRRVVEILGDSGENIPLQPQDVGYILSTLDRLARGVMSRKDAEIMIMLSAQGVEPHVLQSPDGSVGIRWSVPFDVQRHKNWMEVGKFIYHLAHHNE